MISQLKKNSKRTSGNALSPLGAPEKDISAGEITAKIVDLNNLSLQRRPFALPFCFLIP